MVARAGVVICLCGSTSAEPHACEAIGVSSARYALVLGSERAAHMRRVATPWPREKHANAQGSHAREPLFASWGA